MGGSIFKPFHALVHLERRPHTVRLPYEKHTDMLGTELPTERYRGYHTNNIETCIGCGFCGRICMNEAITYVDIPELKGVVKGLPKRPVIDYGRCCFCGLCTDVCPTKSLKLVEKYDYVDEDKHTFKVIASPLLHENEGFKIKKEYLVFDIDDLHNKLGDYIQDIIKRKEEEKKKKAEAKKDDKKDEKK
ncbi:MAG: 4Fe-4S dicluster domain-containing protein [Euryarchaeota archaeon]|nr:4Fe-4S dicluster domain-containing protein [Euryarchaeota archaeon]